MTITSKFSQTGSLLVGKGIIYPKFRQIVFKFSDIALVDMILYYYRYDVCLIHLVFEKSQMMYYPNSTIQIKLMSDKVKTVGTT